MKRKLQVCLFLLLSWLLTACGEDGIYSIKVILDGDLTIPSGSFERSSILLLDGSLTIEEGGIVEGLVYQVMGVFHLDGTVRGQVVQVSGVLDLGDGARIEGDLQFSGGTQSGYLEGKVSGDVSHSQMRVPFSPQWLQQDFRRQIGWVLGETIILTVLAAFIGVAFPRPLGRILQALGKYPHISGAMGLLVIIVGLALAVQMLFTIVLIPISLLVVVLFILAVGLGWVGFGDLTGSWLRDHLRRQSAITWPVSLNAGAGTFCFMLVVNLIGLLPGIGDLLSILTAVIGLGAVFLTRFGLREFIPSS